MQETCAQVTTGSESPFEHAEIGLAFWHIYVLFKLPRKGQDDTPTPQTNRKLLSWPARGQKDLTCVHANVRAAMIAASEKLKDQGFFCTYDARAALKHIERLRVALKDSCSNVLGPG